MKADYLSAPNKFKKLRSELYDFTSDIKFKNCRNMGGLLSTALEFVKRNYHDIDN